MSSIFSDPGWRRGGTLLNGETIEVDIAGTPIAGSELVGQVKCFQDFDPSSGARKSNRLIYCVAARYTGSTALTPADAGKVYVFHADAPLSEFSAEAAAADATAGKVLGVLDEYLTVSVRQNDIVWLVVKGPTSVKKITSAGVNKGVAVEVSSTDGSVQTKNTGATIGQCIATANAANADTTVRVNLVSDHI